MYRVSGHSLEPNQRSGLVVPKLESPETGPFIPKGGETASTLSHLLKKTTPRHRGGTDRLSPMVTLAVVLASAPAFIAPLPIDALARPQLVPHATLAGLSPHDRRALTVAMQDRGGRGGGFNRGQNRGGNNRGGGNNPFGSMGGNNPFGGGRNPFGGMGGRGGGSNPFGSLMGGGRGGGGMGGRGGPPRGGMGGPQRGSIPGSRGSGRP